MAGRFSQFPVIFEGHAQVWEAGQASATDSGARKKERRDIAPERANRAFQCVSNRPTQTLVTANEASVVENTRAPFLFPVACAPLPASGQLPVKRSGAPVRFWARRPGLPLIVRLQGVSRLLTPPSFPFACRRQVVPLRGLLPLACRRLVSSEGNMCPWPPCFGLALRSRPTAPLRQVRTCLTDIACFVPPSLLSPLRHGSHRLAPGPADVSGAMCFTDDPR